MFTQLLLTGISDWPDGSEMNLDEIVARRSTAELESVRVAIERELSRRRGKSPITELKEWEEFDRLRKVTYSYTRSGDSLTGTITIRTEQGITHRGIYTYTAPYNPTEDPKKIVKRKLAVIGLTQVAGAPTGLDRAPPPETDD